MGDFALVVGLLLMIHTATKSAEKKAFSGITKAVLIAATFIFALYTVFISATIPPLAGELIGQAAGVVIILIFFVGIGSLIHRQKEKRLKKAMLSPEVPAKDPLSL